VLNIDPDEVWPGRCDEFGDKGARDSMRNTHECLAGICLSIRKCFLKIAGESERGGTVWCMDVQLMLFTERFEIRHAVLEVIASMSRRCRFWMIQA
jgi:hypothetical protein